MAGFEDLATKSDLKDLKQEIIQNIRKEQDGNQVPEVVLTEKACLLFGGVSDKFLHGLRNEGKLNPKKIGTLWFWNVKELVSLLPQDPE